MGIVMDVPSVALPIVEMDDFGGAPDVFAHGWAVEWGLEVITGISFVERMERGVTRRLVACRVHYPRSRWLAALDGTLGAMKGAH